MSPNDLLSRRLFLNGLAVVAVTPAIPPAVSHSDFGPVRPPLPAPTASLLLHDCTSVALPSLLTGHATAVQLMFSACTTVCPMQGAIFSRIQKLTAGSASGAIRLLSLSIDPQNDNAAALSAWRARFHAGPEWLAAAPLVSDLDRLKTFFGQGSTAPDDHSTQVYLFNAQAMLVWRSFELPAPEGIAQILLKMAPG